MNRIKNKLSPVEPLLELFGVWKQFPVNESLLNRLRFSFKKNKLKISFKKNFVNCINGIDLKIYQGETVCLVGESGCGKSTLARLILKLIEIDKGVIEYQGNSIHNLSRKDFLPYRRKIQMIFQNPFSSLNPRMTINKTLIEPLKLHFPNFTPKQIHKRLLEVLESVGLNENSLKLYPHQFSGGQRQRIGIARALIVSPEFIIADEPISALDISIQSQIINLLKDLQKKYNLTYLFITHNLSMVKYLADRVCVMYLGVLCETGENKTIFKDPQHPYTKILLKSIPDFGKKVSDYLKISGEVPTPINLPKQGCVFASRCPHKQTICLEKTPLLKKTNSGSQVACHLVEGL